MRGSGGVPGVAARVVAFLKRRGEPASSRTIAQMFLRMSSPSEQVATRLLRSTLEPAGLAYREGAGWHPADPGSHPEGSEDPGRMVVAVVDHGPGRVRLAEATDEGAGRPARLDEITLAGATVVMLEPRRDAAALAMALHERGLPRPERIISLRSALRGTVRLRRGADLAQICSSLGIHWLEGQDAARVASAMASCVAEALARRASAPAGASGREEPPPAWITPDRLAAIPRAPGVYRFYDASGDLLYVGKAADLRRRLESYLSRSRAAGHGARFLPRAARVEHEVTGSELEALLREARLIGRRRPAGNVQLQVHERPGRGAAYGAARSFALLLPGSGARGVTVLLVREGRYAGHVVVGPRGGGLRTAARLMTEPGAATRRPPHHVDRDTRILNSWLAGNADRVSRLDLDSFASTTAAARALREAIDTLRADPEPSVYR